MRDDYPKIKKDLKVNAVQLVNDVLENIEKWVSNWCKLKIIITSIDLPKKIVFKGAQKEEHSWNDSKPLHCVRDPEFSWFKVTLDGKVSDYEIIPEKLFLTWIEDLGRERKPQQKEQYL